MNSMAIGGTAEFQNRVQSAHQKSVSNQQPAVEIKQGITPRVDQVQISAAATNTQLPSEPDTKSVEVINPAKEMFKNAESHQQVDLVSGQIAKNQLETYQKNYQAAQGNSDDNEKSSSKVIHIKTPTFYDKVAEAYKEQQKGSYVA